MLAVIITGAAALALSTAAFAGTPSLGAGCGSGATITGSDTAGKFTLGSGFEHLRADVLGRADERAGLHGDERDQWRRPCGVGRPQDLDHPADGRRAVVRRRHDLVHLRQLLTAAIHSAPAQYCR